ncbi:MAG: DNA-directed RNA polymerase subunit omega [Desulfosudaceae bacterium]
MARITVEDCLKKVGSRFELVHLAAQRVRQIREGSEYLVISPKNEDIVVALREIAAGKVTQETIEAAGDLFINDPVNSFIDEEEEDLEEPQDSPTPDETTASEDEDEFVEDEEDDDEDEDEEDEEDEK